jgi:hypothetical protein
MRKSQLGVVKPQPRPDEEDRAAYIKSVKERLNLNEKVLGLSSKRAAIDGKLKYDMPYLEFNKVYGPQHGIHVYKPHEMQWSLDQFYEKMLDTHDE